MDMLDDPIPPAVLHLLRALAGLLQIISMHNFKLRVTHVLSPLRYEVSLLHLLHSAQLLAVTVLIVPACHTQHRERRRL